MYPEVERREGRKERGCLTQSRVLLYTSIQTPKHTHLAKKCMYKHLCTYTSRKTHGMHTDAQNKYTSIQNMRQRGRGEKELILKDGCESSLGWLEDPVIHMSLLSFLVIASHPPELLCCSGLSPFTA